MKHSTMKHFIFLGMLALAAAITLTTSSAFAARGWYDAKSSCSGALCDSRSYSSQYAKGEPVMLQLYAKDNECLRVEVTSDGGNDLQMALVSSDPDTSWSDDDSGVDLKPRIEVDPTPNKGWYTLVIGHWQGYGGSTKSFTVKYGRYNSGNPNCSDATTLSSLSATSLQGEEDDCKIHPDTGELICD